MLESQRVRQPLRIADHAQALTHSCDGRPSSNAVPLAAKPPLKPVSLDDDRGGEFLWLADNRSGGLDAVDVVLKRGALSVTHNFGCCGE